MDLKNILALAKPSVLKAGAYIHKMARERNTIEIEEKFKNNLVSIVDKTAEEILVEGLSKVLPEAGFLTEEQTVEQTEKEWRWIIDPLDGTTNFLKGVPTYSVSVALVQNNKEKVGLVYDVENDWLFTAHENGGAFQNDKPIKVSDKNLKQSLLATGYPHYKFENLEEYIKVMTYCMQNTLGLRRLGSSAIDLCYTANGTFDGFFEYGLNPWDIAAGTLIVKEAGGIVKDFKGEENYLFGESVMAGNTVLFNELLAIIRKEF